MVGLQSIVIATVTGLVDQNKDRDNNRNDRHCDQSETDEDLDLLGIKHFVCTVSADEGLIFLNRHLGQSLLTSLVPCLITSPVATEIEARAALSRLTRMFLAHSLAAASLLAQVLCLANRDRGHLTVLDDLASGQIIVDHLELCNCLFRSILSLLDVGSLEHFYLRPVLDRANIVHVLKPLRI